MKKYFTAILLLLNIVINAQSEFKLDQNELILPAPILFETGNEKIKIDESKIALNHIKAYLESKTYISLIRIESHTDNTGKENDNQMLSEKRAKSVYQWLVNNGIDCKRIIAVGFGSTKPKADNSTVEGRAENRRISVINAELRNRAIGGMPIDGGGIISGTCR